jgi:hypothetical protein
MTDLLLANQSTDSSQTRLKNAIRFRGPEGSRKRIASQNTDGVEADQAMW